MAEWEIGERATDFVSGPDAAKRIGLRNPSSIRAWAAVEKWPHHGWMVRERRKVRRYLWGEIAAAANRRGRLPAELRPLLQAPPVFPEAARPMSPAEKRAALRERRSPGEVLAEMERRGQLSRPRSWRDELTTEQLVPTLCPMCGEWLPAYVVADHMGRGPRSRPLDPDPRVSDPGEDLESSGWRWGDGMTMGF